MCPHHAQKPARKPWPQHPWGIPPQAKAALAWAMEDVLAVDTRPDHPRRPPGCRDETSTPLVGEPRGPISAAPGRPARVDDEDARQGTAHLLMGFEPLAGQRRVQVTERRTAVDCAHLLREVVEAPYPQAEKIVLVMDHRNTHQPAAL